MTTDVMKDMVKTNLNIEDESRDLAIEDIIQEVINYCNLTELPNAIEPYIRKKVKGIIDYEVENGTSSVFDVKQVSELDTTTVYHIDANNSKAAIYGLSQEDKKRLQIFRRLRK